MTTSKTNRFDKIAKKSPTAAQALASACAQAHHFWEEVFASLRAIRQFAGVDAVGYLSGCHFAGLDTDDNGTLPAVRDEAQAYLAALALRVADRRRSIELAGMRLPTFDRKGNPITVSIPSRGDS